MADATHKPDAGDASAGGPRRPFSAELWGVTRHYRGRIAASVMENGRVVERGTHAELLRSEGAYAQLWLLQQRMAQAP